MLIKQSFFILAFKLTKFCMYKLKCLHNIFPIVTSIVRCMMSNVFVNKKFLKCFIKNLLVCRNWFDRFARAVDSLYLRTIDSFGNIDMKICF